MDSPETPQHQNNSEDTSIEVQTSAPGTLPNPSTTPPVAVHSSMSNRNKLIALAIVLVVLMASGGYALMANKKTNGNTTAKSKTAGSRVKVGVLLALSGSSSSMGYGSMKGILLAQKQLGA